MAADAALVLVLSPDELKAKIAASKLRLAQSSDQPAVVAKAAPAPPVAQRKHSRQLVKKPPTGAAVDIHKSAPEAPEAEQAVLGAMLQWPEQCVPAARYLVTRDHFFNPVNAELFQIMLAQFDAGRFEKSRWLLSFTQYLRDSGRIDALGGAPYVTQLATEPISELSVSFYAQMLREKFVLRQLIAIGTKLVRASYGATVDDIGDIIDDFGRWFERVRDDSTSGLNGSEPQTIAALQLFDATHDPNTLVGRRWLVRGGTSLWAGGSGYGKSALQMQLAIYWACGRACFGLRPVRALRSLILQAENDLGDMSEQFQGVYAGIAATQDFNLEESKALIDQNVIIHRVVGKTGTAFLALLDSLIQATRCDMIWIDPLFAFAGCDLLNPEKTGRFLREGLFPIVVKRNVACHVLHHVGKPPREHDDNGGQMSEIDYQYLGFGTSEMMNAFRAVNVIVPIASTRIYKLVLSKRGERAGAKDVAGEWTRTLFLEHSKEGVCWLQTDAPESDDAASGRPPTFKLADLLNELSVANPINKHTLRKRLFDEINMSRATFYRLLLAGKKNGSIIEQDDAELLRKET